MTQTTLDRRTAIESAAALRPSVGIALSVVAVGLAVLWPFLSPDARGLHIGVVTLMVISFSVSYDLFVGVTGYLAVSHASFMALGAYGLAILTSRGWAVVPAWILAVAITALVAVAFGALVLWRTRGFTFTIVSLGFAVVVHVVLLAWIPVTRGPFGIHDIPSVPGIDSLSDFYYAALGCALLVNVLHRTSMSGSRRRRLLAIRENERLAESVGLHTFPTKLGMFVLAASLGAMAAGLYVQFLTIVTADLAWLRWIILLLVVVVVAGPGHLVGVNAAAVFFVVVPEVLRAGQAFRELLIGVAMLATVLLVPEGWSDRVQRWIWRRRLAGG
jgi:branched-chain amino acid transport system permease protein